ncbi:hypothetical protein [Limosilactobacillus caccae]|uniref:hypothetical protein n=1 Tax=Limosilactobacillus caccae TaxID=1926284 RepID=UPI0009708812|nr:hypothetical protein [Limosilactobacillus caccae]
MEERTLIDGQEFAMRFAQVAVRENYRDAELTMAAKKFLLSYLTAYYLVDDFNSIERTNFTSEDTKKFKDMSFDELLKRVSELNKY